MRERGRERRESAREREESERARARETQTFTTTTTAAMHTLLPRLCLSRDERKHGLSSEQFSVSAYGGSSKNLKDLKDLSREERTGCRWARGGSLVCVYITPRRNTPPHPRTTTGPFSRRVHSTGVVRS